MTKTINFADLTEAEWDELLSAVGHHAEVLEEDADEEREDELWQTKALLLLLARRGPALPLTKGEREILEGSLEHHEEVYSDAVLTEDEPERWLPIYQTTRSLRAKIKV